LATRITDWKSGICPTKPVSKSHVFENGKIAPACLTKVGINLNYISNMIVVLSYNALPQYIKNPTDTGGVS
jgi:hypothetical protein